MHRITTSTEFDSLRTRLGSARRIHVVGAPGTGKSLLSRRLAEAHALPVHSLDEIAYEGPEFAPRDLDEVAARAAAIAAQPRWVSEGIFIGWTEPLLEQADLIIWLDHLGWAAAARRITTRWFRQALQEAAARSGTEKVLRFRDYARNLRQLFVVLATSREYWGERDARRYPVTRRQTRAALLPYDAKVVHVQTPAEAAKLRELV